MASVPITQQAATNIGPRDHVVSHGVAMKEAEIECPECHGQCGKYPSTAKHPDEFDVCGTCNGNGRVVVCSHCDDDVAFEDAVVDQGHVYCPRCGKMAADGPTDDQIAAMEAH